MNFTNVWGFLLRTDLTLGRACGDTGTEVIELLTCGITLAWGVKNEFVIFYGFGRKLQTFMR